MSAVQESLREIDGNIAIVLGSGEKIRYDLLSLSFHFPLNRVNTTCHHRRKLLALSLSVQKFLDLAYLAGSCLRIEEVRWKVKGELNRDITFFLIF